MAFIANSDAVARAAMGLVDPTLVDRYALLIKFLSEVPEAAAAMRSTSAPTIGSKGYIESQATAFANSRMPRSPQPPATVPDEMVSVILHEYFGIPAKDLERAQREHSLSMAAENIVGDLLERYLASVLEPRGWIWCSGSMVKAVDFIKEPAQTGGVWKTLQVKNRDNSENSSSSAIRKGTDIEKWFRTFSKKVATNWAAFPHAGLEQHLSEAKFKAYVRDYLKSLRT